MNARRGLHGALSQVGSQALLALAQIAFGAVTARLFAPADFGMFVIPLSLYGVLSVVATTGFPSYVLSVAVLDQQRLRQVRRACLFASVVAVVIFGAVIVPWLALFKVPQGLQFFPVLALSLIVAPASSVELAWLRRCGHTAVEGVVVLVATFTAYVAAAAVALVTHDVVSLALSTLFAAALCGIFSTVLARRLPSHEVDIGASGELEAPTSTMWGYIRRVSTQNIGFLALGQAPGWSVAAVGGAADLGAYSRATTVGSTPAAALGLALTKAGQPYWRRGTDEEADGGLIDLLLLAGCAIAIAFGLLAGTAGLLTALWLGPGWSTAVRLAPVLVVAGAFQTLLGVLVNRAEIRGDFRTGRWAQVCALAGLALAVAALFLLKSIDVFAWVLAAAQAAAVAAALRSATQRTGVARHGSAALVRTGLLGVAVAGVSWGIASLITGGRPPSTVQSGEILIAVISGVFGGLLAAVAVVRFTGIQPVLARLGVQPPFARLLGLKVP